MPDLKDQLVTANRILANEGIIRAFGHVSVREPGSDEMLISRSLSPKFVERRDIVRMDFDGNVLDDRDVRTYGETRIHSSIYRKRDDVNAVVHHHAKPIMPFTMSDTEIKPVYPSGALFDDGVPTFGDYDSEKGPLISTPAEGRRMAESLGQGRAQLLQNHGSNVVGGDLKEAINFTYYLVQNASHQLQAEFLGDPQYLTGPEESIESLVNDVKLQPLSQDRLWEYLKRSLP